MKIHQKRNHEHVEQSLNNEEEDVMFSCEICGAKETENVLMFIHKYNHHQKSISKSCLKDHSSVNKKHPQKVHFEYDKHNEEDKRTTNTNRLRFHELHDERSKNDEWRGKRNDQDEEEVLMAEIKENEDNERLCRAAKEKELNNFDEYKVFQEVELKEQKVLGSRFVLTQKEDGTIKARLVTKGFQESDCPQTDSPTASRDTLKIFCTIAANEKWTLEGSDVRSAFLQADSLSRDVFIEPPPERKRPGIVWKLLKPCYGLKDASRLWFQSASKRLINLGMKQSLSDSCLFYFHKDGKLQGLLMMHVDDLLSCGTKLFNEQIISNLRKQFTFGRITNTNFEYTGIRIFQNEKKEIFLDQDSFVEKMEFYNFTHQHYDNILGRKENKFVRRATGQLNWVSSQTRPDLSFDSFLLSTKLNKANYRDAVDSQKATQKAKQRSVKLKFSYLGQLENLHIELYPDASLGNIDENLMTKSIMG